MGAGYPSAVRWVRLLRSVVALGLSLGAASAHAQVTEPNGVQVPGVSSQSNETTLQSYFDGQNENIDALSQASAEPSVFSPLCDFTATLVLSQSQAQAGLAWYNVPASSSDAPSKFFRILPNTTSTGQVIAASDIRASTD